MNFDIISSSKKSRYLQKYTIPTNQSFTWKVIEIPISLSYEENQASMPQDDFRDN